MRLRLFKLTKVFRQSQISLKKSLEIQLPMRIDSKSFRTIVCLEMCFESSNAIIFQIQQALGKESYVPWEFVKSIEFLNAKSYKIPSYTLINAKTYAI